MGTYLRWANLLRRAWQHALADHLTATAHSPRSGSATKLRLKGISFTKIMTLGRGSSDKSLLTYLDVHTTMTTQILLGELAGHGTWLVSDLARNFPWW